MKEVSRWYEKKTKLEADGARLLSLTDDFNGAPVSRQIEEADFESAAELPMLA